MDQMAFESALPVDDNELQHSPVLMQNLMQGGKSVDLTSLFSSMGMAAPVVSTMSEQPPRAPAQDQILNSTNSPTNQSISGGPIFRSMPMAQSTVAPASVPLPPPGAPQDGSNAVNISLQHLFGPSTGSAPPDDINNLRKIWESAPSDTQLQASINTGMRPNTHGSSSLSDRSPTSQPNASMQTADTLKALDELARAFRYSNFVASSNGTSSGNGLSQQSMVLDMAPLYDAAGIPPTVNHNSNINNHTNHTQQMANASNGRKSAMEILRAMLLANQQPSEVNVVLCSMPMWLRELRSSSTSLQTCYRMLLRLGRIMFPDYLQTMRSQTTQAL